MSTALMSLLALGVTIVVSCFMPYNPGYLSIGFSFIIGVLVAGMKTADVIRGFPTDLFIILAGVTYLFGLANTNGTLERLSNTCIRMVRGRASFMPIVFFVIGFFLAAIGPGAIPVTALLAPPAMLIASKMKINPFLMAIFVVNGANSAAMSPICPSGAIASGIIHKFITDRDISMELLRNTLVVNLIINFIAYFVFGGLDLLRREKQEALDGFKMEIPAIPYETKHIVTLLGIAVMMIGALVFKMHVGFLGITIGIILVCLRCGDEAAAIKAVPWATLIMVCGVSVLIGIMHSTGGTKMAIELMAQISTPGNVVFITSFVPGVISAYASTTGVVFPSMLPLVPGLAETVGGNLEYMFSALCLGGLITDASPLSTLGALAVGAATPDMDRKKLFNMLMIWGLSMAVVGSVVAWIIFR